LFFGRDAKNRWLSHGQLKEMKKGRSILWTMNAANVNIEIKKATVLGKGERGENKGPHKDVVLLIPANPTSRIQLKGDDKRPTSPVSPGPQVGSIRFHSAL